MKVFYILLSIFAVKSQGYVEPICTVAHAKFINNTHSIHYEAFCPTNGFLDSITYDMLPKGFRGMKGTCRLTSREKKRTCKVIEFPKYYTDSFFPTLYFKIECDKSKNQVISGLNIVVSKNFNMEFQCEPNMGLKAFNQKNFTCCLFDPTF
jgi:hypothetical protein